MDKLTMGRKNKENEGRIGQEEGRTDTAETTERYVHMHTEKPTDRHHTDRQTDRCTD